jgi:L-lactate dehydrogenase complex protein LldE
MTKPNTVYVFGTCLIDLFDPQAGMSAIKLLEHEGLRVVFPDDQSCCGQPAYTSGFPADALAVAERQVRLFTEDWPIVVPSGSCAGMMKHHWPRLFGADHPLASQVQSISKRVYEFTNFLVNVLGVKLEDHGQPCKVVLHTSCSARREMNAHLSSRALLNQLSGVEIVQQAREAECCGFGGTFSVRHPGLSAAMAGDKAEALIASGAEKLVSADCGCLSNINGTLAKQGQTLHGQHIATFIAERIQLAEEVK